MLIVDEASMVHLEMMASLLDALPPGATPDSAGRQGPAGVGGGGRRAGRPVPRGPGRQLQRRHGRLCAGGQRRDHPGRLPGPGGRAGAADRHAAPQPPLRRPDRPTGAGRQRRRRRAPEAVLREGGVLRWIEHAHQHHVVQLGADGYAPYLGMIGDGPGMQVHEHWVRSVLHSFEAFRILCAVRDGEWGVA
ncbi:hypothetical protein LP420_37005 [Massilia sp. B-10]|nr:hypothetical protein LP420_37005 [Massilia sp. B-10]